MKRLIMGLAVLFFSAAAAAQSEQLGAGDAVRVIVFQQPDLTTEARINDAGTIAMPLIGQVKLAGETPAQAAKKIANAYKEGKFLRNPQVSVARTTIRSQQVSVLGLVARPGRYALEDTSFNVSDVIAAAGGITPEGSEVVTVLRKGKAFQVNILQKAFALQPGDTVNVERAPVFYIYGEVTRSGAYRLEPGMTVMQAIAAGGGITPRGSDRRLKLRRQNGDGKVVETDAKLSDVVKADDVIFVKEALF